MKSRRSIARARLHAFAAAFVSFFVIPGALAQTAWKPERPIEIVVGSTPGGGTDLTGRVMQKIIQEQKLAEVPVNVINRPGGGQTVAWTQLTPRGGDAHYVSIVNEPLITNRIMGVSPLGHDDFTPIALLFNEYVTFFVQAESPLKSGSDLVQALSKSPGSRSFGFGSSLGNNTHLAIGLLGKAVGVDVKQMKVVVFKSGGETVTSVLGGHIDVGASTIAPAISHIKAGRVRALALTSPQRLRGELAGVPTWRELGQEVTYASWRVLFGPKGLTRAQLTYWENLLGRMVQSPDWKSDLDMNYREGALRGSAETKKFLDAEHNRLAPLMSELGLAKTAR